MYIITSLAIVAVGSGVIAWASASDEDIDRLFGPDERLDKCRARVKPREGD
jgi:hypothetical protein